MFNHFNSLAILTVIEAEKIARQTDKAVMPEHLLYGILTAPSRYETILPAKNLLSYIINHLFYRTQKIDNIVKNVMIRNGYRTQEIKNQLLADRNTYDDPSVEFPFSDEIKQIFSEAITLADKNQQVDTIHLFLALCSDLKINSFLKTHPNYDIVRSKILSYLY